MGSVENPTDARVVEIATITLEDPVAQEQTLMSTFCLIPGPGSWQEMGEWLDQHMPNPPLPDLPRWTLHSNQRRIEFFNDHDALIFSLRWGG